MNKNIEKARAEIDAEIKNAINMQKVFLGLSAMWRRKASAMGKRVDKFKKCKKDPRMFRMK